MTVSMCSVSIPVFIQHLNGLNTILDKASAWDAARKKLMTQSRIRHHFRRTGLSRTMRSVSRRSD